MWCGGGFGFLCGEGIGFWVACLGEEMMMKEEVQSGSLCAREAIHVSTMSI